METAKRPAASTTSCSRDACSTQTSSSTGSSDTEVTLFAVIAWSSPSGPRAVTSVTPVGNSAIASRKARCRIRSACCLAVSIFSDTTAGYGRTPLPDG